MQSYSLQRVGGTEVNGSTGLRLGCTLLGPGFKYSNKARRRYRRSPRAVHAAGSNGEGHETTSGEGTTSTSTQAAECLAGAPPTQSEGATSEERLHAWKELIGDRHYMHSRAGFSGRVLGRGPQQLAAMPHPLQPRPQGVLGVTGRDWRLMLVGAVLAVLTNVFLAWATHLPLLQRIVHRFIWWGNRAPPAGPYGAYSGEADNQTTAMVLYSDTSESVEWINMCWRKAWRVYQRGLEKWLADLLQPVFDNLVAEGGVPSFVQRLRILEFSLDHEAPYFSNMRRRQSRKDSDLNGVVDVRYTGGARMLLLLVVGQGRWRVKIPVLVSDLDLESRMWIKVRLAPMCPFLGTISLAFVGPPNIKVQLLPYNRVRLMRIPILQAFLTKLLTIDLPGLMVLPKRLEINIPPAVTAVAEAAVGREAVMRAVRICGAAGRRLGERPHGSSAFGAAERSGRRLPAHPLQWRAHGDAAGGQEPSSVGLSLAEQPVLQADAGQPRPYAAARMTRPAMLAATAPLSGTRSFSFWWRIPRRRPSPSPSATPTSQAVPTWVIFATRSAKCPRWENGSLVACSVAVPRAGNPGELHLHLVYKPFEDDEEEDEAYSEADYYARTIDQPFITDVKSAADASSRAAVAASAAAAAVAVTKAAAARAAAKAARRQMAQRMEARRQALEAQEGAPLESPSPIASPAAGAPGGKREAPNAR
eukprot:jgi/Botrbrau1/185/Bobra.0022s0165.1